MGNSEVGHLNLGAGAVVRQDLMRIDDAVADGSLARNEVLRAAFADARRVHLLGLVSDGGVHSSLEHLRALIALGRELSPQPPADVVVHAFTDGRDTLPHAGAGFLAELDATAGGAGRLGRGALLGDGPGPALGPHRPRLRDARARASPLPRRQRRAGRPRRLRARRDGRVHRAHPGRPGGAGSVRATASSASTSGPTGCASSCARWPSRASARTRRGAARLAGPRRRRAGRATGDADPLRGGLALPDRLLPRTPRQHALGGAGRRGRRPSCMSPRRRSTRT